MKKSACLAFLLAAVFPTAGFAVNIPYTEDFDDEILGATTPSEPAPESGVFSTSGGTWSVVGGDDAISGQSYNVINGSGNQSYGASIDFSGVLGGPPATASDFTFSSEIKFNLGTTAVGGGSSAVFAGLGFLGASSTFGSGYFVDINGSSGAIRFVRNGSATTDTGSFMDAGDVSIDTVYTLTITGVYIDTNSDDVKDALQLFATVSGGELSGTISLTDFEPATGNRFGYRLRNSTSGADGNVTFDNFVLTIPEPSTVAVLFGGLGAMGLIRRRRS
jgi:hypothetical protein